MINAVIESEYVKLLTGELEKVLTPSESGQSQQIFRCSKCKVALWSNYGGSVDKIRFVRVGTLETPSALPPRAHIFWRSKLPWVTVAPGAPTFDIFYEYEEMWTPDELKRRKLAKS